jgi:hypothetical protein
MNESNKLTLVVTPPPSWKLLLEQVTFAELKDIYEGIMHPHDLKLEGLWVVRLWDGMDGCWCDCTEAVMPEAALRVWFEKTEGGEKATSFNDIDYYRVFPANTKMKWDGGEGRGMFR